MAASQPTARGTLGEKPLCELLVYMLSRSLSGSLVLQAPRGTRHALTFAHGGIVKARVECSSTRLGQVLVSMGYLDAVTCGRVADGQEGLFGQRARQAGVSEEQLARALREQRLRQLTWLSLLPAETVFGYYEEVDHLQQWGGSELSVDALAAIWAAVREVPRGPRMDEARTRLRGKVLRLHPASRVARFEFSPPERAVLDVLRVKPQTYGELLATALVDELVLQRIVYALALTKHLDLGGRPIGVSAPRISLSSPRTSSGPEPDVADVEGATKVSRSVPASKSRRSKSSAGPLQTGEFLTQDEIHGKKAQLEGEPSAYEVLGLEADVPQSQVGAQFSQLARRWHPDRLKPDLEALRGDVTKIFARMTEAYRTIGNPTSREQYDAQLRGEPTEDDEQRQVATVLRAAGAFQKAQILLKKRDFPQAEAFAQMAAEGDPEQPEYLALYCWIRARRPDCEPKQLSEYMEQLRNAAKAQPNNPRILFYLATVLKLAGKDNEAMGRFEQVVGLEPSNLEAARELRLFKMRRTQVAQEGSSLFGRLFKR